jgi:hypothetical protein
MNENEEVDPISIRTKTMDLLGKFLGINFLFMHFQIL